MATRNEAQRLRKLRGCSDEELIAAKGRALQQVKDIERVQGERKA